MHGKSKRRTWRKFHIGIDAETQDTVCCELTGKGVGWEKERDDAIATIHGFGGDEIGRKLWKICSGYHERSLVETAMFRIKKMLGEGLKSRSMGAQKTEALCKSLVINKMNNIGMPKFEWVIEEA